MNDLFLIRILTAAVNAIKAPSMRIYNQFFKGKEHLEPSDLLEFDIITGSQKIMKNISIMAPAQVRDLTGRKTITMKAPRLSQKRFIATAALNALRAMGGKVSLEQMKDRIARELKDIRGETDRTLEFWAANALKGKIYDSDLSTILVDYNMAGDHKPVLAGTALWTHADSDPIAKIREWKQKIDDDCAASISKFVAIMGKDVMTALLKNANVLNLLKYDGGRTMAEEGDVARLAGVEMSEYGGSFIDDTDTRRRYINDDEFLLVGVCEDLVDCPYAPVVDDDAPGGVGNIDANGAGALYFSKSWKKQDPSGRWIKAECRPLPVLQRPDAIIDATAV